MSYRLTIARRAEKEIARLPPKIKRQVIDRILRLEAEPHPHDMQPLKGEPDAYRVDSGEYRILLHLDAQAGELTIFRVKHRRDVYRNL